MSEFTYAELYASLRTAELHILYLEECLQAASQGVVTRPNDYRQQMYAIKWLQNKGGTDAG